MRPYRRHRPPCKTFIILRLRHSHHEHGRRVGPRIEGTLWIERKWYFMPMANANMDVSITDPSGAVVPSKVVTDVNGQFQIALKLAMEGAYTIKADYAGDPTQSPPILPSSASIIITAVIPPQPVPTTTTLAPSATSGYVGDTINIVGSLV